MSLGEFFHVRAWVTLIDLAGGFLIAGYVLAALVGLFQSAGVALARRRVAEGAILGLSFKVAGSLLKTIELRSWDQILMFGTVLALRIILKKLFTWEEERLQGRQIR